MNIEIRKKSNKDFEKAFSNLMNNSIYGKRHGKCEKKKIKLVTTEEKRNYSVSKPTIILQSFSQKIY